MAFKRTEFKNKESFIAQARMKKVFAIIQRLREGRYSVMQLSKHFDVSDRTIYRYLDFIEALGLPLEETIGKAKYFIAHDGCPLCGSNHQQPTTK